MNTGPGQILTIQHNPLFLITRNGVLFQFENKPSWQTLSKALDMSKKTLLTFSRLSKDVKISWVIDNSWLIPESPGWKPDLFLEMSLLAEK